MPSKKSRHLKLRKVADKSSNFDVAKLDLAKLILDSNRKRNLYIPQFEWGELPWDILLMAYVSLIDQTNFTIKTIGKKTNAPHSLIERYVNLMTQSCLLQTESAFILKDEASIHLTTEGKRALDGWLDSNMRTSDDE